MSQWEKPTEWKHAEKLRVSNDLKNGCKDNRGCHSVIRETPKKARVDNDKGFDYFFITDIYV
jgi:hypothetical protein